MDRTVKKKTFQFPVTIHSKKKIDRTENRHDLEFHDLGKKLKKRDARTDTVDRKFQDRDGTRNHNTL